MRFNCKASAYTLNDNIIKLHEKHNHEPIKRKNLTDDYE